MKSVLILQHVDRDSPGKYLESFARDGFVPTTVRLWAGEEVPHLASHDLMFVLGGPQDVWEEDKYPWLRMEKQAIKEWVAERAKPYFGVCLGHQLLAASLGGKVGLSDVGEHGVFNIDIPHNPNRLVAGLSERHKVVQWHMAEVSDAPPGAQVLGSSEVSPIQVLAIGEHALSTQFHSECGAQSLMAWTQTPGYIDLFEAHKGKGSYEKFLRQAYSAMSEINTTSERLYDNLVSATKLVV